MADGFAQATRGAALVNLHSAAGVGHALGNIFTAYRNQTPLVIIAGQQARSILPFEPFLYAEQAAEFPRPYVKWSCEPARAEDVPGRDRARLLRGDAAAARPDLRVRSGGRLGPRALRSSIRGASARRSCGDPALLAEAAAALARARRPVIVVGAGVARDDAWDGDDRAGRAPPGAGVGEPHVGAQQLSRRPPAVRRLPARPTAQRIVAQPRGRDFMLVLGAPAFTYHVEGTGRTFLRAPRWCSSYDDPGDGGLDAGRHGHRHRHQARHRRRCCRAGAGPAQRAARARAAAAALAGCA